jgi:hypothetical protein
MAFKGHPSFVFIRNFKISNVDHDDDIMSLDEFNPILEINLHAISSQLIVRKKIMMHF